MATYKPQIKTNSGVEDIEIDASTLDGKDSSHYLNYNNLTNKPNTSGLLPKTTYEWNKEIAFSNTGKLCIGKFPMYDSNLTVEIKATTSKTYSAILVIATQNVKNTELGTLTATVYGDPNNDVGKNIYIDHVNGSNMIGVYFSPEAWSKNLIHIQAVALNTNANYGSTAATDICTNVASIPATATKQPTNALKQEYGTAKNIASALNTAGVVNADGTLKAKYDSDGNKITDTYLPKAGGEISGTLKQTAGNLNAYGDLSYHNEYITLTSNAASSNVQLKFKTGSRNGNNSEEVAFVTDLPSNATTSKAGLMSSTDKTNLDTLSNLLGDDSDAVVNKINEVIEIFDSYPEGDKIADALAGKQSKVAKLGSTTKPVYVSDAGTFAAASTYAGGTKVTLNGTDKGASTATIYAPTTVGTSGQILKSNGSGAPTWVAQSTLSVGYASSAGSATAATTAQYATNDQLGNNIKDTYATKAELAKLPTTDTWRVISVNGATIFGSATNTAGLNLQAGNNVTIKATAGSPNVTIDVKDTVALKTDLADYLPLTGGTIDGNLTLIDNSDNSGTLTAPCIELGYTDDIYGSWYYDEGIYVGAGDAAHLHPLGLTLNADDSSIELNGSNSNIFIPSVCGLINNADRNAFGFDDGGCPTILNHNGRYLQIATTALDDDYIDYEFPEYSGYVPVTATQGTSGQVLTSNGNGTYKWSSVSGGGGNSSFNSAENITADLESQSPTEFDLDCDTYKELIVCTRTQDDIYELSDDFGNTVSCKEIAVMHLNYMSEDEMLIGTMTSDTGVSKPFISSNLRFFAESRSSITLNVIIYGR